MIATFTGNKFVNGQIKRARLDQLLKSRLCVLRRAQTDLCDAFGKQALNYTATSIPARIQKNGSQARLKRIGKDRFAPMPATFHFTGAQMQSLPEFLAACDFSQRGTIDERRTQTRHLAFISARMRLVDQFGNQRIDQRIAEKLQAFVVPAPGTAMGQRLLQQGAIGKLVAKQGITHIACYAPRACFDRTASISQPDCC